MLFSVTDSNTNQNSVLILFPQLGQKRNLLGPFGLCIKYILHVCFWCESIESNRRSFTL